MQKKSPCERKTRLQGDFLLKNFKNFFKKLLTLSRKYYIIKSRKGGDEMEEKERLYALAIAAASLLIQAAELLIKLLDRKTQSPGNRRRRAKQKR
jgi:hypothetical protein